MKEINEKIRRFFSWHPEPKESKGCFPLFNPSHRKKTKIDIIRKFLDVNNWSWRVDENAFENGNSLHRIMNSENETIIYFDDSERYFGHHPKFNKLMKIFGYDMKNNFDFLLKKFIEERFDYKCEPLSALPIPLFNTQFI